jgi:hypothetical protein
MNEIPYGYCRCGCGEKTTIIKKTDLSCGRQKGEPNKYLVGHSAGGGYGDFSTQWLGGVYKDSYGYIKVLIPGHDRADCGGYVKEHIMIAEKACGYPLPESAVVHHCGEVWDNSKLVVCEDNEYHRLLHIRQRALKYCGDANKRKCKFCNEHDHVENLFCRQNATKNRKGWNVYHMSCKRAYEKQQRDKKSAKNV